MLELYARFGLGLGLNRVRVGIRVKIMVGISATPSIDARSSFRQVKLPILFNRSDTSLEYGIRLELGLGLRMRLGLELGSELPFQYKRCSGQTGNPINF